jgi:hypothetical protein
MYFLTIELTEHQNNCTLLHSNTNTLLKLANTDSDAHKAVKFGCGCVEDSHE